jgi:hypothetical protein
MVTDPGSSHGPQPAAPPPGTRAPGERRPRSERFWSWLRVVVLLPVAIGLGVWGYLLRPIAVKPLSVVQPTITILANEQDVTATVDMALSFDPGQTRPYSLILTLTPTNSSQSVKFAVSFDHFPSGSLHMSHNAYYTVINSTPGLSGTASQSPPFTYRSAHPIGENIHGAQLRVAFPNLFGEKPGSQSSQACGSAGSLVGPSYSTICTQLGNQSQWATPLLEAGTTTFSAANPALGDYQYLAGDNPTLLGTTTWMWSGVNGVTMLAASVPAQDNEQNDLFYSGLLLGVAAAAGIACVTELLRPAWRKGTAANQPGK